MLRLGVMFVICLVLTMSTTEILKLAVGSLRPGFARTCLPNWTFPPLEYSSDVILNNDDCIGADLHKLTDYRKSFPSGHTSYAFASSLFLSLYFLWRSVSLRSPRTELSKSLFSQVLMVCVCLPVWCAILIGASRITDSKHFPIDVLAGAVLGSLFAVLTFCLVSSNLNREYFGQKSVNHQEDEELGVFSPTPK
jgi:diacylglycerol diphosphate phosphatase / phosphatidate phosphatase